MRYIGYFIKLLLFLQENSLTLREGEKKGKRKKIYQLIDLLFKLFVQTTPDSLKFYTTTL